MTNTGTVNLTITSISVSQNFAQQNNCTEPVGPGGTCTVQVSFAPGAAGALQGVLTVFGNLPSGQITTSLSGTGLAAGNVVVSPISLNFGNSLIGTATPAQNITISNTGGLGVTLQTPAITGDFKISANTCGAALAPNFGCTISVIFNPTTAGGRTGVFSISDSAGTQTVQLSGNGQASATAVLSGTSLNFSQPQAVGTKSSAQQVMLTNNGDVSLTDIAVTVNGDFIAQNNCGSFLVGHASCAISVVFVPTKVGLESGTLSVNTQLGTQAVSLSGTGVAPPGISALPTTLNFGSQGVNSTSAPQRVTLTNNGGSALTGLSFSVTGDFAIADSNCSSGEALNAQSSCYVDLTFAPQQAGPRSGALTAGATNLSTPFDVALTGTGEDFQLIVSGSSSAVIVSGQTATFSVQVIPVNGSAGTLNMGCTGVPQNASCTVNPATVSIANGATGNATVTVTTGIASSSSAITPLDGWRATGVVFGALLPCAFLGIRKRAWSTWAAAFLLAILLLLPTACGVHATGGSTSTSPSSPSGPTTPSGVYTLNINAAIPGLQRSVPVTVTVQ